MKLLITGASGFVGQRLIQYYAKSDIKITAVSRTPRKRKFNDINAISWQQLDAKIISEQDLVVNLAGTNIADKRWTEQRKKDIKTSRIEATQTISKLCSELGNNAPMLFNASAIGIYPSYYQKPAPPYNEQITLDCLQSSNFLMETACQWEEATSDAIQKGVHVTHLRFGVILGPEAGMLKQLLMPFKLGLGAKLGNGQQTISWISIIDVVRAIDYLWQKHSVSGPVNITSPNSVSQDIFANELAKALNRPRLFTIPKKFVELGFGEMGHELLLKGQNINPSQLENIGFQWQHPTLNKCFKDLL